MKQMLQTIRLSLLFWVTLSALLVLPGAKALRAAGKGDDWTPLGEKLVDKTVDRDEITVGAKGLFTAIKLTVNGADIEMLSMRVVFATGADQNIDVRKNIRNGGETRAIDLDGRKRLIRKVVLIYKTERAVGPRARVTLYGRQ